MPRADTTLVTAGHVGEVTALAFGPTDDLIATGGEDGMLCVWRIGEVRPIATIPVHDLDVECACFTADGDQAVTGQGYAGALSVVCLNSRAVVRRLRLGHRITALAPFDSDGVAAGCINGDVIALDARTGRRRQRWRHGARVNAVCVSFPMECVLSGGEDGRVCVWHAGRTSPVRVLSFPAAVQSVAVTADGREIVVAGHAPVVQRYDFRSGKCLGRIESDSLEPPLALVPVTGDIVFGQSYGRLLRASPKDGYRSRRIATVSGFWERLVAAHNRPLLLTASSEPPCCALRTLSGKILQRFDHHVGSVLCIAPHPRRPVFLTGGTDTTVRLHDLRRPIASTVVGEPLGKVSVLAWPSGGRRVYVGDLNGEISAWDVRTRHRCWRTPLGDRSWRPWRQLVQQGQFLAALDDRGDIALLQGDSGHVLQLFGSVWPGVQTKGIGFVPGRPILLLGTTRGLWELELAGRWVGRTRVLTRDLEVSELVVAPSGTCYGLEEPTCTIWKWNRVGGNERGRRFARAKDVHDLRLSPDGRWLLASADDVRVWDTRTGRVVRRLHGDGYWWQVSFLAGSKMVVVADRAHCGKLRVYRLDLPRARNRVIARD